MIEKLRVSITKHITIMVIYYIDILKVFRLDLIDGMITYY